MLKPVAILALAALGLAACTPADAELDGDLDVGGTEPAYWTVDVQKEAGKAIISVLGEASLEGALPVKAKGEKDAILLTSKTPEGDFVMTLTHKECFDGLADVARPWSVLVTWKGETLVGCARPREAAVSP